MKIAVFGAGGIGAYFGGRLAQAGAEVHLLARGDHLRALREHGLRVRSIRGDFELRLPATDDPAEIGPCDYVLFCVKSFDTEGAAARLKPLLQDGTAVISLQNGVENEEEIASAVGWEHVMGGAAYVYATIAEPGVVEHTAASGRMVFGEMDGSVSERAERLVELVSGSEIEAVLSPDIRVELWTKFAFICAQAGLTAAVRLPIEEIRSTPESWAMFRRMVEEVWTLARAEGIPVPDDLVERQMAFTEGLPDGTFSSLHYDLTHGKPMELEALHGTVVRRAARQGVAVPMSEAVYAVLLPWSRRNRMPEPG